jgi:Zn-finger nucleic acid-binding protein
MSVWHTCPCCGVERRPHREGCDVPDACPEEEADWAEMSDLRAEITRLREAATLTAAEREVLRRLRDDYAFRRDERCQRVAATIDALLARNGGGE